jgi:hypothetical protein
MRVLFLLSLLLLSGCPIQPHPFKGPNGRMAYSMKCSGIGRSLDTCYDKASELCPDGYAIIDRSSEIVAAPTSIGMMATTKQYIAVECK